MLMPSVDTSSPSYGINDTTRMESKKLNLSSRFSVRAILAATMVLLSCSLSYGGDVIWTGLAGNTAWENGSNWNLGVPALSDSALLFFGTVDFTDSDTSPNLRAIVQEGGTLNICLLYTSPSPRDS